MDIQGANFGGGSLGELEAQLLDLAALIDQEAALEAQLRETQRHLEAIREQKTVAVAAIRHPMIARVAELAESAKARAHKLIQPGGLDRLMNQSGLSPAEEQ